MIESFLKLIESYPTWARIAIVAGIVVAGVVLVFARQSTPSAELSKSSSPVYLRIVGVSLYPDDPDAEVQIVVGVNRTEYIFPSVGGVKWMKVGPDMNRKIIPLPVADSYEIWFKMNYKTGKVARAQDPVTIYANKTLAASMHANASIPYAGSYKLYPVESDTASPAVVAVVSFELTHSGL